MTSQLQHQFINALKALQLYHKNKDLQEVVDFLEQPNINIMDEENEKKLQPFIKLLLFIRILINKYPEVLYDSHGRHLSEFTSIVINNLKSQPSEIKYKPSSNL